MSKYQPLHDHLRSLKAKHWRASFVEIEEVIGKPLPASARKFPAWWANDDSQGRQSQAWLNSGFATSDLSLTKEEVSFERRTARKQTPASSPRMEHIRFMPSQRTKRMDTVPSGTSADMEIEGYVFERVLEIKPLRSFDGIIQPVLPQTRYHNNDSLGLHKYGQGPFCKFKITTQLQQAGVYAISVDGYIKYVGECENLSSRFNMGYGNISPRNCYDGGQQTNCRINTLIHHSSIKGREIVLWFHGTKSFKQVEQVLRDSLRPDWNRV